jgi:hypothetical protein
VLGEEIDGLNLGGRPMDGGPELQEHRSGRELARSVESQDRIVVGGVGRPDRARTSSCSV